MIARDAAFLLPLGVTLVFGGDLRVVAGWSLLGFAFVACGRAPRERPTRFDDLQDGIAMVVGDPRCLVINLTIRFRFAMSAALRRLATWADPYPGLYAAAQPAPITLVTCDANGKRVLISVPADQVQYMVTASYPTHEDFERDRKRRVEL